MKTFKQFITENTQFQDIINRIEIVNGQKTIQGNVDLSDLNLTELPNLSDVVVIGDFYCSCNNLTSLQGAPKSVGGCFYCNNNNLTSLQGAPKSVEGYFDCTNNNLTSLQGAPQSIEGNFYCYNNNLTSLQGAPKSIEGDFSCYYNKLTSLQGAPNYVGGTFKTDKFSDADYRKYIENRKMKEELDPETSDLFGGMIDTL